MRIHKPSSPALLLLLLSSTALLGCQPAQPPAAQRSAVTLPVLAGDIEFGKRVYERECSQCHQLSAGKNNKAPQLARIYGARAASLADYQSRYSSALTQSGWVWDAATLDRYLTDAALALPDGKMLSDPLPDTADRQAVIAYLSTIR